MRLREFIIKFLGLLVLCLASACQNSRSVNSTPNIILWAWERPENLEFIDSSKISVAFLAQTIELNVDKVEPVYQFTPLYYHPLMFKLAHSSMFFLVNCIILKINS